jgi:hypothetical protein
MFETYTGYNKGFYDVLMQDGFVYTQIWPNAGRFRDSNGDILFDDMVHNPSIIKTRESEIHPADLRMDGKMTLDDYTVAMQDKDAYRARRHPVAEAEEAARVKRREEEEAILYEKNEANILRREFMKTHSPPAGLSARKQRRLGRSVKLKRAQAKLQEQKKVEVVSSEDAVKRKKLKKLARKAAKLNKKRGRK